MRRKLSALVACSLFVGVCASYGVVRASDHDDGEPTSDLKGRAVNLTDHYAFRSPDDASQLTLVMYINPRSLPGYAYFLSTQAHYEFHVARAASKTAKAATADNVMFRFEATDSPNSSGVQNVRLTVFKDGKSVGTATGKTTSYSSSKANEITTNTAKIGDQSLKYFIGTRSDGFHFDVIRYFQVRAFLADRFFGGANGTGNAKAGLADNCRGDKFLATLLPGGVADNEAGGASDGDVINLFNPPSCAPDFTKNYNVTAITMNVPVALLQKDGETVFDTWSTISVPKN